MKAIETVYNGYRFRSRLEARWAVFFDVLGIKYEYEKEGYDLDGVQYLPDYWLPEQKCWFEVKGQCPTREEYRKAKLLARHGGNYVYIAIGEIKIPPDEFPTDDGGMPPAPVGPEVYCTQICEYDPLSQELDSVYPDWPYSFWCECPSCGKLEIIPDYTIRGLTCSCLQHYEQKLREEMSQLADIWGRKPTEEDKAKEEEMIRRNVKNRPFKFAFDSCRLLNAYTAARQARFEHGTSVLPSLTFPPASPTRLSSPLPRTMIVRENTRG